MQKNYDMALLALLGSTDKHDHPKQPGENHEDNQSMSTIENEQSQKVYVTWETPRDSNDPFESAHRFLQDNPEYDQAIPPDISVKSALSMPDFDPIYIYRMAVVQNNDKG